MRILVFGDSIAQGFFDADGGWVDSLRKHFDTKLITDNDLEQPTVFNLSVSGDFTRSILDRFEFETSHRIWPGEEFAFVLAIGANDTLYRESQHESEPNTYREELARLVKLASKFSDKILLVGLFPVVDSLLQPAPFSETGKCYSTERMKLFNDTLRDFCENSELKYVDVWSKFEQAEELESLLFDGIHPNAKGHKLIAETVLPVLEEVIQ